MNTKENNFFKLSEQNITTYKNHNNPEWILLSA